MQPKISFFRDYLSLSIFHRLVSFLETGLILTRPITIASLQLNEDSQDALVYFLKGKAHLRFCKISYCDAPIYIFLMYSR